MLTWWQGVISLLHDDRAVVCHDVGSSPGGHAQAPVGTDGEAALPLWQVCLEVALELVGGLVIDALPFERAILPGTPQASPLGVPVHSLQYSIGALSQWCVRGFECVWLQ